MSQLFQPPYNDYQVVDLLETIQFSSKIGDGKNPYAPPVTVPNCLRRERRVVQQQGGSSVVVVMITWHIWVANLPVGLVPKYGDKIFAPSDQTIWIVEPDKGHATASTRYRLSCKLSQTGPL